MKLHMFLFVVVFCVSTVVTSPVLTAGTGAKKTEVEGTWKLTKESKWGPKQLTFAGNKVTLTFADDRVIRGTFKINTEENPSWMDITIQADTQEQFTGKVALCIYEFNGEEFTWCASIPGRKRRPPQFAEIMGDARLLLGTYKMDKK